MADSKRVNAGHKAALHNPNVSEETKQHEKEYLESHGAEYSESGSGGYKATTHNPNVSEEAKEHAKEELEHNERLHNYEH
ncbi:conidiation protein 6 [Schizosaccharomyces cryophilus OY26]|uniref:Conidiation protein 6 n=1 Tax=Schizosaccharomyces cryophilus (strain OY26 / ATCC MYA-4695 / CBS 11777 / NBRC 106824 / NRRL Y48691) TaxID=653667 RepID=S9VZF9_SCHCR|nr:conidiation protein 6 [Schizosaccharomyces cryophilus OY26]EPY51579.1 conidiation protein 6 [Schizosaccharomyces cryophilus OY26]